MPSAERYLWVKGKAGLGNRILVLLDSLLYAEMTGRNILIDWRDGAYAAPGENAFPKLFDSPVSADPATLGSGEVVAPATWKSHLDKSVDDLFAELFPSDTEMDTVRSVAARYTIDVRRPDYAEPIAVRWGWTHELYCMRTRFVGAFASYAPLADDEILRAIMRARVRPSASIATEVEAIRTAFFSDPVIGLHIRYSDRKNPYESYFPHVDAFLARHKGGVVFVATDNQAVEAALKGRYPRVVATKKWFPPPEVPIHRNRHSERDRASNAREALVDLYLLGACDALVFNATSTFGQVASLISGAPDADRIDMAPFSVRRPATRVYQWLRSRGLF